MVILCSVNTDPELINEELGIESICSYLLHKNIDAKVYYFQEEDYKEILMGSDVKIIGFNVYMTNYQIINKLVNEVKESCSDITILVGGHFVTHRYDVFEFMPKIDFVVRGEGEITSHALIKRLLNEKHIGFSDIDGISYRDGAKIIINPNRKLIDNLDMLPWPVRPLADKGLSKRFHIESARGCTGTCSFCSACRIQWRSKSVKNTVDEMEYLNNKYDIDVFWVNDSSFDNPNLNIKRMNDFVDEIEKRNFCPKIALYLKSDIYKVADNSFWDKFIHSGLCTAFIGVESFFQSDLKLFNKKATVDDNVNCINNLKKEKFQLKLGFIYFHPYATYESLKINNLMLYKHNLTSRLYQFNFLQIYKGTEIYNRAIADSLYIDNIDNITEYHYKEPFVGQLASHFKDNIMGNNVIKPIFDKIQEYFQPYERLIYIVHRQAIFHNKEQIVKLADSEIEIMNSISLFISELLYTFLDEYIDCFSEHASPTIIKRLVDNFIKKLVESDIKGNIEKNSVQFVAKVLRDRDIKIQKYI